MSQQIAINCFTLLPPEILHNIFNNYIRPALVRTHNTKDLRDIQLVNKMFASLVRPWKLQVAQAQADYYGGFFESHATFLARDRPIPLRDIISQNRLNLLLKNPMFNFREKVTWMFACIPDEDEPTLLALLLPLLSFRTRAQDVEHIINEKVIARSHEWTHLGLERTAWPSRLVIKNPTFYVNGQAVGKRWMYAARLWIDEHLLVSIGDEFLRLGPPYDFEAMFPKTDS
ncbi:hypothetical protein HK097_008796 [Rhizophlyctis rosea]|uniref:F-box domain-containing protein n=1 Tax=Rhizophlyctis rosea TaxID=64517 RepID=A0AAD5X0V7_9FUNG|nr:hypothetical protein HK097_008796 [Rhizophlyctis rosea]